MDARRPQPDGRPRRASSKLARVVAALAGAYGKVAPAPVPAEPFALVLWENAAYLVDDERRARVVARLRREVGLAPEAIAAVGLGDLAEVLEGSGMRPLDRAGRLHECARLALEIGAGELARLCREEPDKARPALKRFPGIGDSGADKILLLCGAKATLAPESNGLRVLLRLGFGDEDKSYSRSYASACAAVAPELPGDLAWLADAHRLLRRHGQECCKAAAPRCDGCPVREQCAYDRASRRRSRAR